MGYPDDQIWFAVPAFIILQFVVLVAILGLIVLGVGQVVTRVGAWTNWLGKGPKR
jgi:hypothetical protein